MHFGGLAIGSLFKNSVGSYSTERIEQLHMNMNSQALQKGDLTVIIVVIIHKYATLCSYEKSTQVCHPKGLMILKTFIVQIVSVHSC